MKLEESNSTVLIRCDKCTSSSSSKEQKKESSLDESKLNNSSASNTDQSSSPKPVQQQQPENSSEQGKIAIAKCSECDQSLCANCLLEHQLSGENINHKLSHIQQHSPCADLAQLSQSLMLLKEINNNNNMHMQNSSDNDLLSKISETMKASSFLMNSTAANLSSTGCCLDDESLIEKKRDCQAEFLMLGADEFLPKCEDLYQENIIKRRYSNLDSSEFETSKIAKTSHNQTEHSGKMMEQGENSILNAKIDSNQDDLSLLSDFDMSKLGCLNQAKFNTTTTSNNINNNSSQDQQIQFQQQQLIKQHQLQLQLQQQQQNSANQQQQQQQSNARLLQIESEINKTFQFYIQTLRERKEYLIKELNTIVQFALLNHSQNINKQVQVQYQLELKKQQVEKELNDYYDLLNGAQTPINLDELNLKNKLNLLAELNNVILVNNQLISQLKGTNPLMSIEFISNYSAIQTSIRNTFGFIRINQQGVQNGQQSQQGQVQAQQNAYNKYGNNGSNNNQSSSNFQHQHHYHHHHQEMNSQFNELSILGADLGNNKFPNQQNNVDMISSPISINKKQPEPVVSGQGGLPQWTAKSSQDFLLAAQNLELVDLNSDEDSLTGGNSSSKAVSALTETNLAAQQNMLKENPLITLSAGSTSSNKSAKSTTSSLTSSASSTHSQQSNKYSPTYSYLYDSGSTSSQPVAAAAHHSQPGGINAPPSKPPHQLVAHSQPQAQLPPHIASSSSSQHLVSQQQQQPSHSTSAPHSLHHHTSGSRLYSIYDLNLKNSIQLTRSKMIYHCKFGEFGINDGQFTEPSGVTINTNNDIIVADTNSHRIQIFDREGNFKFKFGECGKRDGQLLYPNRVSIVKQTGDIVVTERSPTHQIQIYNKYGQFLRKFGATILQHPRGVCVDYKGRIVVVECKVMRVIIFDLYGNVLNKFNCNKYLEFPNGVCCSNPTASNNYREEIYISDNRAHCIKVFDYQGTFLRQIGGEGITNYPIGVGINSNNEILVADNHNNFNLTVFTQEGKLINALESKVKHAQCFDVGLMDDGSIVLASKDYRIYVYKYSTNMDNSLTLSSPTALAHNNNNANSVSASHNGNNNGFPSSLSSLGSANKYDLFGADNNNNNSAGLYNYFKPAESILQSGSSSNQSNNFANFLSDFATATAVENHQSQKSASLFANHNQSEAGSNFLLDTNVNDLSSHESNSLLNLSTNTTTTNNLASILNGILLEK